MINVITSLITVVGLLRDAAKHKFLSDKMESLKQALDRVDDVYECLALAKDAHDKFELVEQVAFATFCNAFKTANGVPSPIKSAGKSMLAHIDMIVTKNPLRFGSAEVPEKEDMALLSVTVRNHIERITELLPEFDGHAEAFEKDLVEFLQLLEKNNFGIDFSSLLTHLESSIHGALIAANKLIFNLCPVLDSLHTEIKRTVGTIT